VSIRIRRYDPADRLAIERLNQRLAACGVRDVVYPESPTQPSQARGDPLSQELYVAVDGEEIRGGIWLHEHEFLLRGREIRAGWLKHPVAESLVDRAYGIVPAALLVALQRRQPNLMALGMGSRQSPIARLLAALGWTTAVVPFYVTLVNPRRVFSELGAMRDRTAGTAAKLLARSGLATAIAAPLTAWGRTRIAGTARRARAEPVPRFEGWADVLWQASRAAYGFVARRDAHMLNVLYPEGFPGLTRLRVSKAGGELGWICTTLADLGGGAPHRVFGRLKVGMLADAMSEPQHAATVLACGMRQLASTGADLVVSNHAHPAWRAGLRSLGFVRAPSNFFFSCSKAMAAELASARVNGDLFLNRGDCDGPRWW
jgi:hypothetical protein